MHISIQTDITMALRTATSRLFQARLAPMGARAQSTLNTGEVTQDPQIGDYPNLPRWSSQARGPYGWWDPQDKRNFGEPVRNQLQTRRKREMRR